MLFVDGLDTLQDFANLQLDEIGQNLAARRNRSKRARLATERRGQCVCVQRWCNVKLSMGDTLRVPCAMPLTHLQCHHTAGAPCMLPARTAA